MVQKLAGINRMVVALLFVSSLTACSRIAAQDPALDAPNDGHTEVPLWKGLAPGAQGSAATDIPTITVYLPASNPTHTAIVVVPGGSYVTLARNHEGARIGDWLADHGIAAFVLKYRLGPRYHSPVELWDAQRALRTIRSSAAEYGIQNDHIGMWGFSAGGHLVATAATRFDAGVANSSDPIERVSSRPDFIILGYPVITMMAPSAHNGSVTNLLGNSPSQEKRSELSSERHVTVNTPPTFIFATTDDSVVPVSNSLMFYQALIDHHVPAEMHIYQHGEHGVGLAEGDPVLKTWPLLLENWLVANGWAK